jgi:HNH endonuclease
VRSQGELEAAFWAKVDVGEADDCWRWKASTDTNGYGHMRWNGPLRTASRIAFELHHGLIPPGLGVNHTCDNPPCCNPAHLYSGTQSQNAMDRENRGRGRSSVGEHNPSAKLDVESVHRIRQRLAEGGRGTQAALCRELSISKAQMSRIALGHSWASVSR